MPSTSGSPPRSHPSSPPASQGGLPNSQILNDVVENLSRAIYKGRKRARPQFHSAGAENIDPFKFKAYSDYGRMFQRQSSSFKAIDNIVVAGIRQETVDSGDEQTETAESMHCDVKNWHRLCNIIPDFRDQMLEVSGDRKTRRAVCQQITEGANAARADDTASLKGDIIGYLLEDVVESRKLGIQRKGNKADRGFNHPVTASLLCPIKYPDTQETYTDIKNGVKVCTAAALPRFLFPQGQVYDPEDIENGCFRGHLLVRVAKHILQGPSAALQEPGYHRGQRGVATVINVTSLTPPLLAYLAIQTHFALSSESMWTKCAALFDYDEFFQNLLEILEGPEGKETIALFNHHVFGQPAPKDDTLCADKEESDFDLIKLQRAAKRNRITGSFAPGNPTAVGVAAAGAAAADAAATAAAGAAAAGTAAAAGAADAGTAAADVFGDVD